MNLFLVFAASASILRFVDAREAPGLGEPCEPGVDTCQDWNAECVSEDGGGFTCECVQGFVQDGGNCRIPTGGECTDSFECISNAECTGDPPTCQCSEGFLEESGHCKVAAGNPCTDSAQCVSYAQCMDIGGVNVCTCDDGHVEVDGRCKVALGGECQDTVECVENAECVSDTCRCMQGFQEHFGECGGCDDAQGSNQPPTNIQKKRDQSRLNSDLSEVLKLHGSTTPFHGDQKLAIPNFQVVFAWLKTDPDPVNSVAMERQLGCPLVHMAHSSLVLPFIG
ncbi:unnamed protein product [Darwinula stevensoni]|uniref:EGF-like domain-containing protein n=1 Tax=Darwinula stevensoni TaxID=69355 RepID=A0A7R8XB59_9CRUS|nr:unnamed protein product [Darwinula stevensoni]CAG0890704.1 unnamed protein product [Darwinula stevensoni]